ncbi:hypothetical protein LSM04_000794 [Trypanosoma melophagium]|uniref:uncharacterized protein n=1 Tax=Trypanosoma melophagium TaxID=715481 RepID=UPI00351A9352|nr:hypothetical protein LSM04_000794 [Trypanosoma melophagium]
MKLVPNPPVHLITPQEFRARLDATRPVHPRVWLADVDSDNQCYETSNTKQLLHQDGCVETQSTIVTTESATVGSTPPISREEVFDVDAMGDDVSQSLVERGKDVLCLLGSQSKTERSSLSDDSKKKEERLSQPKTSQKKSRAQKAKESVGITSTTASGTKRKRTIDDYFFRK